MDYDIEIILYNHSFLRLSLSTSRCFYVLSVGYVADNPIIKIAKILKTKNGRYGSIPNNGKRIYGEGIDTTFPTAIANPFPFDLKYKG